MSPCRALLPMLAWIALTCPARGGDLAFRRHVINANSEFMAAAVYDVNKDGQLDIVCGGFWYEGPSWKKHFLRHVEVIGGRPDGYAHQVLDVNGDGWQDIIAVNWRSKTVKWIEHPGTALAQETEWKAHLIATPGNMETGRLVDMLGDGTPAILPSTVPFWWELVRKPEPHWIQHNLPRQVAGHGVGFGDINGNGRGDVVGRSGWAEAPADRRNGEWIWHPDFELGVASVPILVADVDGDGRNDLIWTMAHDYGVYWLQQTRKADGKIGWVRHAIDTSWAGSHAPLWVDLDGDGTKELVVGRRYKAHEGADPGEFDPQAIYRYQFDRASRTWRRYTISYDDDTGFGLDPVAVDLRHTGRLDLVFGGRHGLYWMENLGSGSSVGQKLTHDPLWFPHYADHDDLMVLKNEAGLQRSVQDAFDIGRRRAQTLAAMQALLGALPDPHERAPLALTVSGRKRRDGFEQQSISYAIDLHTRASAELMLPDHPAAASPAIICLGADEWAEQFARTGYVCLVPARPAAPASDDGLYASGVMKSVWTNIRGIDLLETVPVVDRQHIAIVGHGNEGHVALYTAALDCRLAAVATVGPLSSFAQSSRAQLIQFADALQIPRIHTAYNDDPGTIPFDLPEVLGAIAPRPVLLVSQPSEPAAMAARQAMSVYRLRKAAGALSTAPPGDPLPQLSIWLEQALGPGAH